jgi:uncharacterized protein (TIGR02246 family)
MSRSDIEALNASFSRAFEQGDAAALAALYAPDARVLPPGAPATSGSAIQDLWQSVMDMGINGAALKTVAFEEHGDVAIEVGQYELRAGAELADNGKYVVVHRRQPDGAWKMGVDIWNTDRPTAAAS